MVEVVPDLRIAELILRLLPDLQDLQVDLHPGLPLVVVPEVAAVEVEEEVVNIC